MSLESLKNVIGKSCAVCGTNQHLTKHHIVPRRVWAKKGLRELLNYETNTIILCHSHHKEYHNRTKTTNYCRGTAESTIAYHQNKFSQWLKEANERENNKKKVKYMLE